MDCFKITLNTTKDESYLGKATPKSDGSTVININEKAIKEDGVSYEKVLLHELTHAVTIHAINAYKNGEVSQSMGEKMKRLEKYLEIFKERLGKEKIDTMLQDMKLKQSFRSDFDADVTYAAFNLKEFMAVAMTSKPFQQYMKENIWSNDRTMWDKFKELVQGILSELGIQWGTDLTSHIFEDILSVVEMQVKQDVDTTNIEQTGDNSWAKNKIAIETAHPGLTESDYNQLSEEEKSAFINCL